MNTITVNASSPYEVIIGKQLIENAGTYIQRVCNPSTCVIISDSNVFPLYGSILSDALKNSGYQVFSFVFPAGESSKNAKTYIEILEFLAAHKITRSDLLIALGGGVVGDITGFAAATYLRGISYVQIPTSLLAMVDSSVGGKTAIDLQTGKNLVGAFYQPKVVLCDLCTLDTLSTEVFQDGCAEVIKYGVLYDCALFEHLAEYAVEFSKEYVIARCIELKANVVCQDEFDRGERQKLNLGHTIGHGIEAASNYTISHGQAVAAGMAIITKAASSIGECDEAVYTLLCDVLKRFCLPCSTDYPADLLFESALSDKKRSGKTVNLIIPHKIGNCAIMPTPIHRVHSIIEAGL